MLAMAQSRLVARELEHRHPHVKVKLVTVHTRGDHDQRTPLTQVKDPGFFAAELDEALLAAKVDFCVHSCKDLERERPSQIALAAVPERENPRDAILFRADVTDKLDRGQALTIGSSSVRRQNNIGDFLSYALPYSDSLPVVAFQPLRGPVDERLARISVSAGSNRLDGVVLALAGLARLWQDPAGQTAIAPLLKAARWMILPLETCPAAAGQGALAIECRSDNSACLELLRSLHHEETAALLLNESAALKRHADGSEAFVGATSVSHPELGSATYIRGRTTGESTATIAVVDSPARQQRVVGRRPPKAWNGNDWEQRTQRTAITARIPASGALFAAHWHALDGHTLTHSNRCWTSGPTSWRRLAQQGIWVEGCADNLGFEACRATLQMPVLQLPPLPDWTALTHVDALDGWRSSGVGNVLASYTLKPNTPEPDANHERLANCTHFYWASARQYEYLKAWVPADAHHACGAGKTSAALRSAGLDTVQPFASRREWQQWLG
jgi:hydroxymethylbilane synthase